MKKTIIALTLSAVMVAALPLTASAHGHGHNGGNAYTASGNSLCTVEDCNETGIHQHNGTSYAGHYLGDGHDYHQACTQEGCTQTGCHEHDGTVCLPHAAAGCGNAYSGHHSRTNRCGSRH